MAPNISSAPRTYINDVTKVPGIIANINPSNTLPMPTIGNVGLSCVIKLPSASYISVFPECPFELRYVAHEIAPEIRNKTPIAMVIPLTVLSGLLISNIPVAMAHNARKTELLKTFIDVCLYCLFLQKYKKILTISVFNSFTYVENCYFNVFNTFLQLFIP